VQLLRGDGAVAVDVKNGKRLFEILENLVGLHALGVQLDELLQVDVAVAVAVDFLDHSGNLLLGGVLAEALHHGAELRRGDSSVAVGVELSEYVFQFDGDGGA